MSNVILLGFGAGGGSGGVVLLGFGGGSGVTLPSNYWYNRLIPRIDSRYFFHEARVERSASGGRDRSGGPVQDFSDLVYADLECCVTTPNAADVEAFGGHATEWTHTVYFRPGEDGLLPDVRNLDRIRLDGGTLYLSVLDVHDIHSCGVLLEAKCVVRRTRGA